MPGLFFLAHFDGDDYKAAGIPMPPEVIGDEATRKRVVAYTAGLLPVTLAPYFLGLAGPIYFVVALAAGVWFLYRAWRLFQERTDEAAQGVFRVSLAFLFAVFLALIVTIFALVAPYIKTIGTALIQWDLLDARVQPALNILGKLAMADIFLIALYITLAKGILYATIETAWGLYLFTFCVLLSLLVSVMSSSALSRSSPSGRS